MNNDKIIANNQMRISNENVISNSMQMKPNVLKGRDNFINNRDRDGIQPNTIVKDKIGGSNQNMEIAMSRDNEDM